MLCTMHNSYEQTCNAQNSTQDNATGIFSYTVIGTFGTRIKQVRIAYSYDPNLRGLLTSSRLHKDAVREVSHALA